VDTAQLYTPPGPYARCVRCGGVYRPSSPDSVAAHEVSTGHPPVDKPAPAVTEPAPALVLLAAARRLGALLATFDALEELAATWERTGHADRAAELRALLVRPAVHALDVEHDVELGDQDHEEGEA
jgi:hypothetical protein